MHVTVGRWMKGAALGLGLAAVAGATTAETRQTMPAPPPAHTPAQAPAPATAPTPGVTFAGESALVLYYIRADRAADFEAVMAKVKEALQKSAAPERKRQAAGWKVSRSSEPAGDGVVLYVFVIDPVVKGANYSVGTILSEAFPSEAEALYRKFTGSYSKGQVRVNLTPVIVMGPPPGSASESSPTLS